MKIGSNPLQEITVHSTIRTTTGIHKHSCINAYPLSIIYLKLAVYITVHFDPKFESDFDILILYSKNYKLFS
jgi:hypothetical protein